MSNHKILNSPKQDIKRLIFVIQGGYMNKRKIREILINGDWGNSINYYSLYYEFGIKIKEKILF